MGLDQAGKIVEVALRLIVTLLERSGFQRPKISPEIREAVKDVIWQINLHSIAVAKGGDIRILEDVTTRNGFALVLQKHRQNQESFQANSIQDVVLRDIEWRRFESIDSDTVRVNVRQTWKWTYANNWQIPAISDNRYILKCSNGAWRVDYYDSVNI